MVTNPQQYELMHVFPNVYEKLMDDKAKMMIFPLNEMIDVEIIKASFERFMVKDYLKSIKGTELCWGIHFGRRGEEGRARSEK